MNDQTAPKARHSSHSEAQHEHPRRTAPRRTFQKLATLSSLVTTLSHAQELDPLLVEVLKTVRRLFQTDLAYIMLRDSESGNLRVRASIGTPPEFVEGIDHLQPDEGVSGRVLVSGTPMVLRDASTDPRITRGMVRELNIHALASVPLIAAGHTIGVLVTAAYDPDLQITDDVELLEVIGQLLGMAIQNARLLDESRQARKLWESTFNAISDGISVHTQDGQIVKANHSLTRILDMPPEELLGVSCCMAMLERDKPLPDCANLRATDGGGCQTTEIVERSNGQVLRITVDPLLNEEGATYGSVHVVSDITERVSLERRMARAEHLALIGELAAGLAHEVKNPLAGIKGAMEIVLEALRPNDPHRDVLEHILAEAMRVNRIMTDLLDYARPRPASLTRTDVNALVERVMATAQLQALNGRITLEFHPSAGLPAVLIDPDELQKVLLNLLINAIHAVKDQGRVVTKTVLDAETDSVKISVTDNGEGIPTENLENVFRPFFTTKKKGTGLGLATCRRIVHSYGGTLTVESEEGEGSTFTIMLPLVDRGLDLSSRILRFPPSPVNPNVFSA